MLLLMSMCYLSFMRGDIIIEQYEMTKWKYWSTVTNVNGTRSRTASDISGIEDEKEKEEMARRMKEKGAEEHISGQSADEVVISVHVQRASDR